MEPIDQLLLEDIATINQVHTDVVQECQQVYHSVKRKITEKASAGRTLNANMTRQLSAHLQVLKKRLDRLDEYVSANVLAFQKILKKRSKVMRGCIASSDINLEFVFSQPFVKSVTTNQLVAKVESLESKLFK